MGVSFYGCDSCGESVYEEYVGNCNACGVSLCTDCLINNDVNSQFGHEYGYIFDSKNPELMDGYIKEGFELYNDDGEPWYVDGDIIDDSGIQEKYCPFCSGQEINDETLLAFILEKYKLDKTKEWKSYKNG